MMVKLDPKRYDVAIKQIQNSLSKTDKTIKSQTKVIKQTQEDIGDFKKVTADEIAAIVGEFEIVKADIGSFDTILAEHIESNIADFKNLRADVGEIDTLIFGSASGATIQTSFANAVIAQLGDAQIKSAMIKDIAASKITAGDIITNNVRVVSEDGKLLISDETIQISDDTRVRVQIGKDASDDYSINVWDVDGNLMFSEGGITDSAIKKAIIRNDMVSDDANISGGKIDISSLFTEMNRDGTETLKATKVHLDDKNQTLEVAFKEMSDDVSSQGTSIEVIQGQITDKVWSQDIEDATEGLATEESVQTLSTQYSEVNQTVGEISSIVAEHTTEISKKADGDTVETLKSSVTELKQTTEKIEGRVTDTEGNISKVTQTVDGLTITTDDGTTFIDGADIYTGTVTADKIDVEDLFAKDIEATGSITGLTFISEEEIANLTESIPDWLEFLRLLGGTSRLTASGSLISLFAGLSENADHVETEHSAFGSQYKVENEKTATGGDLGLDTGYAEHVLDANSYGLNFRVRRSGESDFLSLFKVDVKGAYWEDSKLISQADLNKGVNGKISRADEAEKDGNGKVIADTYLPLTGGTINGDLDINGDLSVGGVDIKEIVSAGSSVGTLISTDDGAGNVTLSII